MTLTRKIFAAGALAAFIGFPISSVLAQSPSSMADNGASASAPASSSMGTSASAPAPAPNSMNDSSASASSSAPSSMKDGSASASAPAQSAQQAAPIDDATLQKAAKAYVKVKQIVHQTKQASSSSASAQPDQASAQSEKLAAVKNEGLDPQQYDRVIQKVQSDPQLQQKFASYVTQNGGDTD